MIFPLEYYLEEDDADNFRRLSMIFLAITDAPDFPNASQRSPGPRNHARYYARTSWEGFCRGSGVHGFVEKVLANGRYSTIAGHRLDGFLVKVLIRN